MTESMKSAHKMRICFFNVVPMPHTLLLHSDLIKAGYEVNFWYIKDKLTIYPWKENNGQVINYSVLRKKRDVLMLVKDCLKSDLIIITGWNTRLHLLLSLICKIFGKKTACWLDGFPEPHNRINAFIKKQLLKIPSYLFITTSNIENQILEYFNLKLNNYIIFPYLNTFFNEEEIKKINDERKINIENNEKIKILIANRFIERKGYKCIYDTFSQLDKLGKINLFDITILGTGDEYEQYKSLFEKLHTSVTVYNWVEYADYLNYMKNTDIFIHGSSWEPYGIPPADAMACGKLVIASRGVMSCVERITNGENGFLYDIDNAEQLVDILTKTSSEQRIIYEIGKIAYDVSRRFTSECNINAIKAVLLSDNN